MNAAIPIACAIAAKFGLLGSVSYVRKPWILLKLEETERAVVKNNNLHKQLKLREADEIARQRRQAAVT